MLLNYHSRINFLQGSNPAKHANPSKMKQMKFMSIALLNLLLFSSCEEKKTDNPELLQSVLVEYFEGIEAKDFKKMQGLTTDDFKIYEDGVIYNNDSIFNIIKGFQNFTVAYTFDNLQINVDHHSGNIHYFNHADFVFNDTSEVEMDWLESATFKKIDGKWKMDFLHSTARK